MLNNSRIGAIIKIIGKHPGITLGELNKVLCQSGIKVTERTIAKDILALKSEFGLLEQRERLRRGYFLESICCLSPHEVCLVLDSLQTFGTQLAASDASHLTKRLRAWAKDNGVKLSRTRSIRQRNIYKNSEQTKRIEHSLLDAIREHKGVTITHEVPLARKAARITGYPLLIVFHERGWYCIMRELPGDCYRPFRIDRIKSCQLARVPSNDHHDKDVAECEFLINCGWGMGFPGNRKELEAANKRPPIVVRFDGVVAPFILEAAERHPLGKITPVKDGSGDAQFKIWLSNPREFLFWVRSFGSHAWIVSPSSLVSAERAEVRRMADRYR